MFDAEEWFERGGGGDGEGWEGNGEEEGPERDPDLEGGLEEYGPMRVALAKEGEKGEAEGLDPIR